MSLVGKTSRDKKPSFDVWCQRELSRLLKSQVDSEQVQYLLSMELRKDVQEYLEGLLGTEVVPLKEIDISMVSLYISYYIHFYGFLDIFT